MSDEHLRDLTPEELGRVEEIAGRFEEAWQSGSVPDIAAFLPDNEEIRTAALVELALVDMEFRLDRGETVQAEEYLERFPELASDKPFLVALVATEYELRRAREPKLKADEYLGRFPDLRDELSERFRAGSRRRKGRFPIRLNCPHCENPIAIVDDDADEEVICPSCGSSFRLDRDQTVSWQPEKLPELGKFKLLEVVGRGAFGTVYRARDTELDRIVAVKVPRSGTFATKEDEDRFIREARNVAQLHHPSIVSVHEVGHSEQFPYIVTEYVEGISLADALTGRRFTFQESAGLLANVAEALEHSHQQGVVHRDLKPANIMLERAEGVGTKSEGGRDTSAPQDEPTDGTGIQAPPLSGSRPSTLEYRPRLMDFGLARRDEGEITVTAEGQVLGTPAYMSPEQARGESHRVDGRSDVYSLGVILYQLIAGELPFRGNSRMVRHQKLENDPQSPRRLNDRIPRDMETICLKCLEREPKNRYQTARELCEELRRFLNGESIHARPVSKAERLFRWCKRNRLVSALVAGVIVAVLAGLVGITWQWHRAENEARRANRFLGIAEKNLRQATVAQARLLLERGQKLCQEDQIGHGMLELADALQVCPTDATDLQWVIRANLDGWSYRLCRLRAVWEHEGPIKSVAFGPGERVALSGDEQGCVEWHDIPTGRLLARSPVVEDGRHTPVFGPDGTVLRILGDGAKPQRIERLIRIPDGTSQAKPLSGPMTECRDNTAWAVSPDGAELVTGSRNGKLQLWDLTTGAAKSDPIPHDDGMIVALAFSPDGKAVASGSWNKTARLWDASTAEPLGPLLTHDRGAVTAVAVFPNSNVFPNSEIVLLTGCTDFKAWLWDGAEGTQVSQPLLQHTRRVTSVAISPDGRRLLTGAYDGTAQLWNVAATDAPDGPTVAITPAGQPMRHTERVSSVAFSKDGWFALSGDLDGSVRLWEVPRRPRVVLAAPANDPLQFLAISPDGRTLLAGWSSHVADFWDVNKASRRSTPALQHQTKLADGVFSPDGRVVLTGATDGKARLWRVDNGSPIGAEQDHSAVIELVDFSPDGKTAVTAGQDRSVRLWDAATGEFDRKFELDADPKAMAFSPDGTILAIGCENGTVELWNLSAGQRLDPRLQHGGQRVLNITFHSSGATMLTADAGTVCRWTLPNGERIGDPQHYEGTPMLSPYAHDDRTILVLGGEAGAAQPYDVVTGYPIGPPLRHHGGLPTVAYHAADHALLTVDYILTNEGDSQSVVLYWKLPEPMSGTPARLERVVQTMTGMELDDRHRPNVLAPSTWKLRRRDLEDKGAHEDRVGTN